MATAEQSVEPHEQQLDKGLKSGALGLISTTVIATASVAPAYSIAATLVFVVPPQEEIVLSGSAVMRGGNEAESLARAVLDATNRRLTVPADPR